MILHEERTAHSSRSDEFILVPIGDIHLGSVSCHKKRLQEAIEFVHATPNAKWVGMGDYLEAIKMRDDRFDDLSLDPKYARLSRVTEECVDDIVEMFKPIASKGLGLLTGNHEEKLRRRDEHDVHYQICSRLGMKDLGYDSMIRWTFARGKGGPKGTGSSVFWIKASHGTISGRSRGAQVARMKSVGFDFDADLYLFGHGHGLIFFQEAQLYCPDTGALDLCHRIKTFVMTGTFRKTYERGTRDYGERGSFPPAMIGSPLLTIRPWARDHKRVSFDVI